MKMTSSLRRVAIVGASGHLGPFILKALEHGQNLEITVITRTSSSAVFPANTRVVRVADGYQDDEMVEAFRGHDAVVLSLGFAAEHRHAALARASIKAGVKRLVASGYGVDPTNEEASKVFPVAATKAAMIEDLKSLEISGWSWTVISCGLFLDFCIQVGFFGIDPVKKTASIWDDGNARFTATTREGIGKSVVGVLQHPDETANRIVYISSTELSMNELLAAEEKVSGEGGWQVSHVNTEEEIAKAQETLATETEIMPKMMAAGRLGLAVNMKESFGANFRALGLLENELLGVSQESLEDIVRRARE
ncbi:unnamed protein product [Clonostachys rosea f. rosea IK726]|uniref:NmrA-like domain-containing protein n=2 Tax=Bionectria ochroleuca TaxID=29856 RepID=A0A0B7K2T6_BIOOC|nr:unnamed protein product [Clonostachys rosea f. rosea IK726]